MNRTYSPETLAAAKKIHDVTPSGVAFDWWLASAAGAGFLLLREPHHTDEQIEAAKSYLKRERDVVGAIKVAQPL